MKQVSNTFLILTAEHIKNAREKKNKTESYQIVKRFRSFLFILGPVRLRRRMRMIWVSLVGEMKRFGKEKEKEKKIEKDLATHGQWNFATTLKHCKNKPLIINNFHVQDHKVETLSKKWYLTNKKDKISNWSYAVVEKILVSLFGYTQCSQWLSFKLNL